MQPKPNELDRIETSLTALHRALYRYKTWVALTADAHSSLDRAGAALLKCVAHSEQRPVRVQTAAAELGIEAPSLSRKAQQLVDAGLLEKSADEKDGRASNLHLTAAGKHELHKIKKAWRSHLSETFTGWEQADIDQFAALLQKFSDSLDATRSDDG
jgi:DNA-binding MarR family transcriptional regulator